MVRHVKMVVRQGVGGLDCQHLALVAHDVVDCGEVKRMYWGWECVGGWILGSSGPCSAAVFYPAHSV